MMMMFRIGCDGVDDPNQQCGGQQDEDVPARPDGKQGQEDQAHGRSSKRNQGTLIY